MKNGIRKLTPILIILLGFFTFGASDLIWIYSISDSFDRRKFLPMKQIALTVITFGIYGIFWKQDHDEPKNNRQERIL